MPFQDPSGSMHNTTADKLDRLEQMQEKAPLMAKAFEEGLTNYMVKNQYHDQKLLFIRKTYGLLMMWLVFSMLLSIPFLRNQQGTVDWLMSHSWILWLSGTLLFLQTGFYLLVCAFLYTGQHMLLLVYIKMMIRFPFNYIWTLLYVSTFTVILNTALASFGWAPTCWVYIYTALAVLSVFLYTYAVRHADFKHLYAYLVPLFNAIIITMVLALAADVYNDSAAHALAVLVSIVFGWIVIYDTQLIYGSRQERGRKYPYTVEMIQMAAYEMYFDIFVHFYLGALNLFPAVHDPLSAAPGN